MINHQKTFSPVRFAPTNDSTFRSPWKNSERNNSKTFISSTKNSPSTKTYLWKQFRLKKLKNSKFCKIAKPRSSNGKNTLLAPLAWTPIHCDESKLLASSHHKQLRINQLASLLPNAVLHFDGTEHKEKPPHRLRHQVPMQISWYAKNCRRFELNSKHWNHSA